MCSHGPILLALRRAEEGLDERAAVKAVLADNLYGLEIDLRCTQIAAFALALASWKRLVRQSNCRDCNLACSGLAIGLGKTEFLKLGQSTTRRKAGVEAFHRLELIASFISEERGPFYLAVFRILMIFLRGAPSLGSLIDPRRAVTGDFGNLFEESFDALSQILQRILEAADVSNEFVKRR